MIIYTFVRLFEMGTIEVVAELKAKDYQNAILQLFKKGLSLSDFDAMMINGEWA